MRIRTIKPEFWSHRMHRRISEPAALLAVALLNYVDDEGRFEVHTRKLEAALFPERPLSRPIPDCLQELARVQFVSLYQAELDGEALDLGQIINFGRHQVINKRTASRLPAPPRSDKPTYYRSTTVVLPESSGSATVALPPPRKEDSGSPTSSETVGLPPSREGKEGKGTEGGEGATPPRSPDFPEVEWPSEAEVLAEGGLRGIPPDTCRKFFDYYEGLVPKWQVRGQAFDWRRRLTQWNVRDQQDHPGGRAPNGRNGARPQVSEEAKEIRAELQWQRDPERVAALHRQLQNLAAR